MKHQGGNTHDPDDDVSQIRRYKRLSVLPGQFVPRRANRYFRVKVVGQVFTLLNIEEVEVGHKTAIPHDHLAVLIKHWLAAVIRSLKPIGVSLRASFLLLGKQTIHDTSCDYSLRLTLCFNNA